MNGTETLSIDLVTLLVFTMPGFFFVWAHGKRRATEYEYFMFSLFWGVFLYWLFYHWIPLGNYVAALQNPLAGALVFSIIAAILGGLVSKITRLFRM
jgi:hypothetical protein